MTNNLPELGSWRDLAKVNSKRSFFLATCGAVIGLLLAGYALFTARGTSTFMVPAEDVALVNQQPISRSDFLFQLQSLYNVELSHSTREQRQRVLDDMIREELFVQRGKELDVASTDPDVRNALVNAVAPSLIETDMMKEQQALVARIPLGRFGTADEVAQAVMSLIGNAYMTGQTIALSGGMAFN